MASDIPVLREIGADAVTYCPVESIETWAATILRLLGERDRDPGAWAARRRDGLTRAAEFSWSRYTAAVAERYRVIADAAAGPVLP